MPAAPPAVLSIAGSDPCGGAGLQADLRVFAVHRLWGSAVVAATTAQSAALGVRRTWTTPASCLLPQIEAAFADRPATAAKTGMLGSAENVRVVAGFFRRMGVPLVVDPVLVSTSGAALLGEGGVEALRELLPVAAVVTPNLPEAAALLGLASLDPVDAAEAARAIAGLGPCAAVVKGGHGDPDGPCVDHVVLRDGRCFAIESARLRTAHDHGTGCLFSAGIVAGVALGMDVERAIRHGHACVQRGLRSGARIGAGSVWLDGVPGDVAS